MVKQMNSVIRKKIVILLFLFNILFLLSACNTEPVQTNKELTVYIGYNDKPLEYAVDIYRTRYPEVNVTVINTGVMVPEAQADYEQQLAVELMAGKGADVFTLQSYWDIDKMIEVGAFADLEAFYQEDQVLNKASFNRVVMDACVYDGKRFAIPMEYSFPILLSSESTLEETKFNLENCKDFEGFLAETQKYYEDGNDDRLLFRMDITARDCLFLSGYDFVNAREKKSDITSEEFHRFYNWYKEIVEKGSYNYEFGDAFGAAAVRDKKCIFDNTLDYSSFDDVINQIRFLDTTDQVVLTPLYNKDGGITATVSRAVGVRANSSNKQNAWNFIRILFSEEVQLNPGAQRGNINISSDILKKYGSKWGNKIFGNDLNGFTKDVPPLDEKYINFYLENAKKINLCIFKPKWAGVIYRTMEPYILDEANFTEALEETQRQLDLYLTE